MNPDSVHILIQNELGNWISYWNSEDCLITPSRTRPTAYYMRSRYYGRGTCNDEVGRCFHVSNEWGGAIYRPHNTAFKNFRIYRGDMHICDIQVPLNAAWIQQNAFPDPVMTFPEPLRVANFVLYSVSLCDIRWCDDVEMSAIEFEFL